jgi:hypothetical protein
MSKVLKFLALALVCLGVAFVARPQPADDPLDLLKTSPETAKLLFENQFVKVIDDRIPPGVTEPMHRHRHGVTVYLDAYTAEQVSQAGETTIGERMAGTAAWGEAVVHTVKNIGRTPSHTIRIELKY